MKFLSTAVAFMNALLAAAILSAAQNTTTANASSSEKTDAPTVLKESNKAATDAARSATDQIARLREIKDLSLAAQNLLGDAQRKLAASQALISLFNQEKKSPGTDLYWTEELQKALTLAREAKVFAENAEKLHRTVITADLSEKANAVEGEVRKASDIIQPLSERPLNKKAETFLTTAISNRDTANQAIADCRKAISDGKAVDERQKWIERLRGAGVTAKAAQVAATDAKQSDRDGIKAELSAKAQEATDEVKVAFDLIELLQKKTLTDGAQKLLDGARKTLKKAQALIGEYNAAAASDSDKVIDTKDDWLGKLREAIANAKVAKTEAEEAEKLYRDGIKAGLSAKAQEAAREVKVASGLIELLEKKTLTDGRQGFLDEARKDRNEAQALIDEYNGAAGSDKMIDPKEDWLGKLGQAIGKAKTAQENAGKATRAFERHQWWIQFWRWVIGSLCLCVLGAGGYLLFRAWQQLNFLSGY